MASQSKKRPGPASRSAGRSQSSTKSRNPDVAPGARKAKGGRTAGGARPARDTREIARTEGINAAAAALPRRPRRESRASALVETVREHPVPAAMIGAGVAWLIYEGVRREVPQAVYARTMEAMGLAGETLSGAAEGVRGRLSSAADSAMEEASRLGEYAQSGLSRVADAAKGGASAVSTTARRGMDTTRETAADLWESHPVAVGLSLLAVGVAAGLLLPATGVERTVVGRRASELVGRAKAAGSELLEQTRDMASRAVTKGASAIADEADRVGLTPDKLSRKIKRVAGRVQETVSSVAGGD